MTVSDLVPLQTLRRLVLWRHGQTEWNRLGRAQGHADVPLDELGVVQARRAAPSLAAYEPSYVWSSDLIRARQTAEELVALTGNELVIDKRLREYDVGARQGMTHAEFEQSFPDVYAGWGAGDTEIRVPGAENRSEVSVRMLAVLGEAIDALGDGRTGIIVGHGASLRTGLLALFGVHPEQQEMLAGMANCAWAVLEERVGRGWQIMEYNVEAIPARSDLADDPGSFSPLGESAAPRPLAPRFRAGREVG